MSNEDHSSSNEESGLEIVSNPYCSAKLVMAAKGVARIQVSIIRTDLDTEALAEQITNFYEQIATKLEAKNIKVDDYKLRLFNEEIEIKENENYDSNAVQDEVLGLEDKRKNKLSKKDKDSSNKDEL